MGKMKDKMIDFQDSNWMKRNIRAEFNQYIKIGQNIDVDLILNRDEKKQIDDYFQKYYGEKIPYFFHAIYKMYSGKFDVKFMPEYLYYPYIMHFCNHNQCVMQVKNTIKRN